MGPQWSSRSVSTGASLSPHSPWIPSLPSEGLPIPANCTVSVGLPVINCTVCLLFSQGGWLTYCTQRCLFPPSVSLSLLLGSVSDWKLAASCWLLPLQPVFLFTSSDLPSSHCHSFPHLPLRTSKLISPSCRAEFHYSVCLYPSACLSGFPQMGLPLHAGAGLLHAGAPVWE